jgi:hypothetical protein
LGGKLLGRIVRDIRAANQDTQLHVHTEWLSEIVSPNLPSHYRQNLGDFDAADQLTIVRAALSNLREAGASSVVALRAGNMGGSADTAYAAKAAGLAWDMSFSLGHGLAVKHMIQDQTKRDDAIKACPTLPLPCVEDYPGHFRPMALTALSFDELRHAMFRAERERWPYFIIMMHSFELIKKKTFGHVRTRPHRINIGRWKRLCELLDQRRDIFRTVTCHDLPISGMSDFYGGVSRTSPIHTLVRVAEQLVSRIL